MTEKRERIHACRRVPMVCLAYVVAAIVIGAVFSAPAIAQKPDWQLHLDWCIGNHTIDPGMTDCPDQYVATYPECLAGGGRACLMVKAIASAKANDCANAWRLAKICQCHNGGGQAAIGGAGQQAVCDYLKSK